MRCFLAAICLSIAAWGQAAPAKPEFEVISIKRSAPRVNGASFAVGCSGGPGTSDPGYFRCTHVNLDQLLEGAFNVSPDQISGLRLSPAERFEITARVPAGATRADLRAMEQNALAERFGLVVHWETKQVKKYKLEVAKGGPKFVASRGPDGKSFDPAKVWQPDAAGYPSVGPGREGEAMGNGHAAIYRSNMPFDRLMMLVGGNLHTPVINATGLTGPYTIGLRWIPDAGQAGAPPGPSLREALREQLGLILEPTSGPLQYLVVDHMDQEPVQN